MTKDLLVLSPDADIEAVMRSVLQRPKSLGIREITFDILRHPGRDSGVAKEGPSFVRLFRGQYDFALLIWDHRGSGRESIDARQSSGQTQDELDSVSWKSRSASIAIDPELEQWIWQSAKAICRHYRCSEEDLTRWTLEFESITPLSFSEGPKKRFEHIVKRKLHRTISPRDFQAIAHTASLRAWMADESFDLLVRRLRAWFPPK